MKIEKIINLLQQNKIDEATKLLNKYVKMKPADIEGLNLLGVILLKQNNLIDGIKTLEKSLLIKKNQPDVFKNTVNAYQEIKDYSAGIKRCIENYELCDEEIIFKLGFFYNKENSFDNAISEYKKLINSTFNQAILFYNLGISYENNKQPNDAVDAYQKALQIDPSFIKARFNLSILYLYSNNFKLGWNEFEVRLLFNENKINLDIKKIDHVTCSGKNILIAFEYGIGDHILFSSLLSSLDLTRNNYYVNIDKRLEPFIKRKYSLIQFFNDDLINKIDYYIPVGSLGKYLRPSIDSFHGNDYIFDVDKEAVKNIRSLLPQNKIICGISWSSQNKFTGQYKEINIKEIIKEIDIDNISFVNLQYGDVNDTIQEISNQLGIDIIDLNIDKFNDINNLAALISNCNFVITTSNITAHLSGILGKRAFVIPPKIHGKLWYWGNILNGRSLWYESVSVIKNEIFSDEKSFTIEINKLISSELK